MAGKNKIYILVLVLVIIIGGAIYYFGFMSQPEVDVGPTGAVSQKMLPKLDVGALDNPAFEELKSYKALPLQIGTPGNTIPFNKIIFVGTTTTTITF